MSFLKHLATWMMVVLAVLFVFGFAILVTPQYRKLSAHERRLEDLRQERAREETRLQELRVRQQRFQTDPEYVRRVAHEIGMVEPKEMIFRFHEDERGQRYGN